MAGTGASWSPKWSGMSRVENPRSSALRACSAQDGRAVGGGGQLGGEAEPSGMGPSGLRARTVARDVPGRRTSSDDYESGAMTEPRGLRVPGLAPGLGRLGLPPRPRPPTTTSSRDGPGPICSRRSAAPGVVCLRPRPGHARSTRPPATATCSSCWPWPSTRRCGRRIPTTPSSPRPTSTTSSSGAWTAPTPPTPAPPSAPTPPTASGADAATVRYLGFQVMSGIENSGNVVADDLDIGPDGTFEIVLSADPQPGNWMALPDGTSSVVVRQFFYDWDTEEPAQPRDRMPRRRRPRHPAGARPTPLSAAGVARQLARPGRVRGGQHRASGSTSRRAGRAQGVNIFRPPAARTDMGAAAENVSVWGSWELDDDEALAHRGHPARGALLERLPRQLLVGDHRLRQPPVEPERPPGRRRRRRRLPGRGRRRAIPAWPTGSTRPATARGPMIFRWLRAADAPVPATRVVQVGRSRRPPCPPGTATVDAADAGPPPSPGAGRPCAGASPADTAPDRHRPTSDKGASHGSGLRRRHRGRHRRHQGHGPRHRRVPGRRGGPGGRAGPGPRGPRRDGGRARAPGEPRCRRALAVDVLDPADSRRAPSPSSTAAGASLNVLVNTVGPGAGPLREPDRRRLAGRLRARLHGGRALRPGRPAPAAPGRVGPHRQLLGPLHPAPEPDPPRLHGVQGGRGQRVQEPVQVAGARGDPGEHREPGDHRHGQLHREPPRRLRRARASTPRIPTT